MKKKSIKKEFYIFYLFLIILLFLACDSKKNEANEYKSDAEAFLQACELLTKVDSLGTELFTPQNEDPSKSFSLTEYKNISSKLSEGIKLSEKISDKFLDNQHPKLKKMFKDYYLKSYRLALEFMNEELKFYGNLNLKNDSISWVDKTKFYLFYRENHGDFRSEMENILSLRESYNSFLIENYESIFKNFPGEFRITYGKTNEINQENTKIVKKSFWRFLLRSFLSFIVVSLLIYIGALILNFFLELFAKIKKGIVAGLIELLVKTLKILFFALLVYIIIIWIVYCVYTVKYYLDSPNVTHEWLYIIVGAMNAGLLSPLIGGPLLIGEPHEFDENSKDLKQFAFYFLILLSWSYFVFYYYPSLMDFKLFSWFKNLI